VPARNDVTGDLIQTKANSAKYEEARSKLFGEKRQTGSWVYDPETRKLVPKSEYYAEKPRPKKAGFFIGAKEFEAYESPATGQVITNRRAHQYDLDASGCRVYEGRAQEEAEAERYRETEWNKLEAAVDNTVHETDYQIEHGYIKPQEP
jgi:hypothetical protein